MYEWGNNNVFFLTTFIYLLIKLLLVFFQGNITISVPNSNHPQNTKAIQGNKILSVSLKLYKEVKDPEI